MTISPRTTSASAPAVRDALFGGNSIWHRDDLNDQFTQNMETFGITTVRWPGGSISEQYFDYANPDVPRRVPLGTDVMSMDPSKVLTFSEVTQWAKDTGRGLSLVLPVAPIGRLGEGGRLVINQEELRALRDFVTEAMRPGGRYADARIDMIEVGNEYWGGPLTSSQYGQVANAMVKAIAEGIARSGAGYDPRIAVQVGTPWAAEFENSKLSWASKVTRSNEDIVRQLDPEARALVDGIINHRYVDDKGALKHDASVVSQIRDVWKKAGLDLPMNYTEWNTRDLGEGKAPLYNAGRLVEIFEHIVRDGIDHAMIWPVNQSTNSDLAGSPTAGPGHLSANGAAFKLLSDNVRGLSWAGLDIEDDSRMESSLYRGESAMVLFLSDTTGKGLKDRVDLAGLLPPGMAAQSVTVSRIMRDPSQDAFVGRNAGAKIVTTTMSLSGFLLPVEIGAWETVMIRVDRKGGISSDPVVQPTIPVRPPSSPVAPPARATEGRDTLQGTSAHDSLDGLGGDDRLAGLVGNDTLRGGNGHDTLDGGDGDDSLSGHNGHDLLLGGKGQDRMDGGTGNDTLLGDEGNDTISGGEGNDRMQGDSGNDLLHGDAGNDTLEGGAGNDTLRGGAGNDNLSSSAGDDRLFGEDGNDTISAGDGNDALDGGAGHDRLDGGKGNDTLTGGDGNDNLAGGDGNDSLDGGKGIDDLAGGTGNDTLRGAAENDRLKGDDGNDLLWGGEGNDTLYGDAGNDVLCGDAGNDLVYGGTGADTMIGGAGNDTLRGIDGNDRFEGGDGDDFIYFAGDRTTGTDHAWGGAGRDRFVIVDGGGRIHINDFQSGMDKIDFNVEGITSRAKLNIHQEGSAKTGYDLHVDYMSDEGRGTIVIDNMTLAQLKGGDLIF